MFITDISILNTNSDLSVYRIRPTVTKMKIRSIVFVLIFILCGSFASNEIRGAGSSDLKKEQGHRVRRNTATGDQAQIPEQQQSGFPFMMSPNLQTSYFLGQCVMCPPGDTGPSGAPGPQGMPGRDGRDQLIIGPLGDHTLPSPATSRPDPGSRPPTAGVTYTRWGKTSCPSTSQLVYEGVMGSSNQYTQKGSGVNFLCMPLEPTFADPPSRGDGAFIFGVEYEQSLTSTRNLVQSEAPCVVCLAPSKGTVMVVPATNTCLGTQDWTLEYHGYMMSSHYGHFKSEFVCMDLESEGIPRTNHNNNEALLYIADSKCSASGGGLPCPPYIDGYDVLCAVCSL